ncbi:MAG: OmpH family outer membrane protein [Alphaproteobacteria bacterium]|nr:OmpH family outer membrane protein [Alphaproteobacteria bacterium]
MAKKSDFEDTLDLGDVEEKNPPKQKKESKKERDTADDVKEKSNKGSCRNGLLIFVVLLLYGLVGYNTYEIKSLKHNVDHTYVYNMEAVLMQTGMADENRKFETNMANLEKEIDAAEKKVKSMKDKKLQEEYREMYMKSLTLKRNTLVEEHEKFMKSLLKNINKTLAEVAKDNNVKVIFSNKAIIFSTNYVTDVTPTVAAKLKTKMEE